MRINRYIMECKFSRGREVWKSETGINRYIMECKFIYDSISLWIFRELIDTLWNVNDFG